jgi:2,4-didehydro-3-deoxy-L-rhamnonate hydrolase
MRLANAEGRLVLVARTDEDRGLDVEKASHGRFDSDPQSVFLGWEDFLDWALDQDPVADGAPLSARLGPPVPEPHQVFAIGLNYREHAAESALDVPDAPIVFTKFPSCLAGPHDPVELPSDAVDFEVELVVAIGIRAYRVAPADAWTHVAGLTVGQDLSERVLQLAGPAPQFSLGKSFPGFGPTGPHLVTVAELADPDDLEIRCGIEGGEQLQHARTSQMIFPVAELVSRLSQVCPLLPGDLIFTGTPSGVGLGRTPHRYLRDGEVLVSEIEGLGRLRTPVHSR